MTDPSATRVVQGWSWVRPGRDGDYLVVTANPWDDPPPIAEMWTEVAILTRADYEALVAERDTALAEVERLRGEYEQVRDYGELLNQRCIEDTAENGRLRERLAASEQKVAELERDAARLDALVSHRVSVMMYGDGWAYRLELGPSSPWSYNHATPRAAIDAALNQERSDA